MSVGISRFIPTDYLGPNQDFVPIKCFPREPRTTDKKFPIGQIVLLGKNPSSGSEGDIWYLARFDSSGNAIWLQLATGASSPGIDTVTTDDGAPAVDPDASGNINVLGGTGVAVTGQGPGSTVTVSASGDVANSYVTDSGTATPSSNVLNVLGGTNINTAGASDNLTVNLDANINITSATATGAVNAGEVNIDPGASGDSFIQFDINSTNEFRIGVDDTDDSFRISQGGALGTNDTFVMSAAGERTLPLQPSFAAYMGTADTGVTGDATVYTFGSGNALTEIYDRGGDFVTSGTFTAPVTGIYWLSFAIRFTNVTSGHTSGNQIIVTSNRSWRTTTYDPFGTFGAGGGGGLTNYCLADMDAGDTCTFTSQISGSTKTVNLTAGNATSWCAGALYA